MNITDNKTIDQVQEGVRHERGSEAGDAVTQRPSEVPLTPEDEAPIEQDMTDGDAFSAVAGQREGAESPSRTDDPDVDSQMDDREDGDGEVEPRGVPASDPESGA